MSIMASSLIEIPQWGNMTLIEAIWMGSGFLCMLLCGQHLITLWGDWMAQAMARREVLASVAWDNFRRELLRFAEGCVPAGIGMYASITPPPLPGPAVISPVGLAITGLFLANSFIVSLQSKLDWNGRYKVQRMILEGKNGINGGNSHW